ncbi:putative chemotaxis protein CheY [Vibrio maritimus]|uniref:Putative chemotaxis protein CheY n=1 Tax=Vibrio maritimus TaxID=990268 RepID=A0A090T4A7_9VIBR|nr:putative chemotaxis protein CheY [Vibrio maritimus]
MEKLNVICVDDQREVLSAVIQDLEPLSSWLNIEDCESGEEVLDLIEDLDAEGESIAVIVSDHVMPGMTGVELLTELSRDSRFKDTKKVLLTGQATHSDTITAINTAGVSHYFEKLGRLKSL